MPPTFATLLMGESFVNCAAESSKSNQSVRPTPSKLFQIEILSPAKNSRSYFPTKGT
jgi:hypothetical protein